MLKGTVLLDLEANNLAQISGVFVCMGVSVCVCVWGGGMRRWDGSYDDPDGSLTKKPRRVDSPGRKVCPLYTFAQWFLAMVVR